MLGLLMTVAPIVRTATGTTLSETVYLPLAYSPGGGQPVCPTPEPTQIATAEPTATATATLEPTPTSTPTEVPTATPEPTPDPRDAVKIVVLHRAEGLYNEMTILQNMTDDDLSWADWTVKANPLTALDYPFPVGGTFHKRSTFVIFTAGVTDPDDDTIGSFHRTDILYNPWDDSNRCMELYYQWELAQTACPPEW